MAGPRDKIDVDKKESKRVKGFTEAADDFVNSDEYTQITKNYAYYEGGLEIDKALRGGYNRFDLGALTSTKAANRSPKGDQELWRAPAQKDDETWVEFTRRRLAYVNYTQLIIKERGSILYKTPPVRTVEKAGGIGDKLIELYERPENTSKGKFMAFHRNALLGGTVAVVPYPDFVNQTVVLRGFPRKTFHAIHDPFNGRMLGFVIFGTRYNPETRKDEAFYQVWTEEAIYNLDDQKRIVAKEEHYCGEIPVCLFRENNDDLSELHYGMITASDLVNGNEDVNIKLSDLSFVAETQAFSVLFTANIAGEIRVGARGRINAANVTEDQKVIAEYLNPGAQIAELQVILTAAIETLFMTGRIPKGVVMPDDTTTSGVHLKIQWFPVQKLFEEAKVVYGDNERRLAQKNALVLSRWLPKAPGAKVPEIDFYADFNEKNVIPRDDESAQARDEWDLQTGLKSPVDILMERNPDLDEDDAVAEYERVQELNKRIGYTPSGGSSGTFKGPEPEKKGRSALLDELEAEDDDEKEE